MIQMNVKQAIEERRAYRSLEPVKITDEIVATLAKAIQLTPSCFNNQPWRYIFVRDSSTLKGMHGALSAGNFEWASEASLIIAVTSKKEMDCDIKGREYYLFDTGMATAFLILQATELGLVAHPIAGYYEDKIKEILAVPEDMTVITLVIVGKKRPSISPKLTDKQIKAEKNRPKRLSQDEIVFIDKYTE